MLPADQLIKLAQALLNNPEFCKEYQHNYSNYGLNRRNKIKRALEDYNQDTEKNDREQLRRYFDELWRLPVAEYSNDTTDLTGVYATVYFERHGMGQIPCRDAKPDHQTDDYLYTVQAMENGRLVSILLNPITPKETIMNNVVTSIPIIVNTQVLINGKLASQYSDADLFQSIALQEKVIKELNEELNGIENKSAGLVDEIAERKAGIQALVTYLDSRPKK